MNEAKLDKIPEWIIRVDSIDDEIKQNLHDLPVCNKDTWFKYLHLHDKKNRIHLRIQRVVEELIKLIHTVSQSNQEHSIMPLVTMYRTALAVTNRPTTDLDADLDSIHADLQATGNALESLNDKLKEILYTKCMNQPAANAPRSTPKEKVVKPQFGRQPQPQLQPPGPMPIGLTKEQLAALHKSLDKYRPQMPSRIESYNISLNLPVAKLPAPAPIKRTKTIINRKGDRMEVPIDDASSSLPSTHQKNAILPLPR